ncbi:MAG: MATE family efflux transporter [Firmicutes bacterium]|nr:MATE family efflux transporter [Bacillota bacterium]
MKDFYKKLYRLALPISLQSLLLASVAAADAFMLGRIEQNAMAAVSLATQIQFVQNMIISAAIGAGSILGAQYWGKQDTRTINDIFCLMLRICGILSLVSALACVFFPQYLMLAFAHDQELVRIGASYLRIAGWSYLLTGVSQCYLTVMKISDHAAASAWVSGVAVILNIVLNAVCIFGLLGVPAMGARGAALATLISRIVEFGLCIGLSYKKSFLHPELDSFFSRNKLIEKDFMKCAMPLVGAMLLWGIGFTSYTAVMGHMGADSAGANSIASVVRDLVCCFCNGIGAAAGIVVGNELGAGDLMTGKLYGEKCMKIGYIIGFGSTAIVLAVTPLVMSFVQLTPKAHDYLVGMMIIMSVYMIGRVVNTVIINGIFAAGGDTLFDMYSLCVCMWGLAVPLAFLGAFVFHWPVLLVYSCTCLDEVGKIPWVMYHYRKYKWVKDLTRERGPQSV